MGNNQNNKTDLNEIIKKVKSEGDKNPTAEEINNFVDNNLSESQAQAVKNLLSDEEKTKQLLNSDAAKALFRKFFGGENDG